MTVTAKVCLVGDFGVGKTSLVQRFVKQAFSEHYQTTVGVTIETKSIALADGRDAKLVIWDIAGSDVIDTVKQSYLRGAAGLVFVVDGTRAGTLEAVQRLDTEARALLPDAASVFLFNKHDLVDEWEIHETDREALTRGRPGFLTSARTGAHVEAAFAALAERLFTA